MYSPVKFLYIYVCVCVCVCVCVRTYVHSLLSTYMSKISGRDYENLTTN